MNQKLWSGLTATLLISTLAVAPSSYADQAESAGEGAKVRVSATGSSPDHTASAVALSDPQLHSATVPSENREAGVERTTGEPSPNQVASTSVSGSTQAAPASSEDENAGVKVSTEEPSPSQTASNSTNSQANPAPAQANEAVKVGEYQSQEKAEAAATIATIQSHEMAGKQAATLYVRNIPVLTFLSSNALSPSRNSDESNSGNAQVKVAAVQDNTSNTADSGMATAQSAPGLANGNSNAAVAPENPNDPVWRATTTAAHLNQLYRDNVDASTITVAWSDQQRSYVIKAGKEDLVKLDANTILPDTTRDPGTDALQATNRIRRQVGNAPPLSGIAGGPRDGSRVSLGPVQFTVSGLASWYGPGLDGNASANGETFNQNALTAAHRTLPFGTQVRVTNKDTGQSVVVRITDRGPFGGGRVIDLSTGAARVIGLIQAGVAPVSLEVLGRTQTTAYGQ